VPVAPPHPDAQDTAFLPRQYTTTPRTTYVLAVLAFAPVVSGGACFVVAPGSFQAAREAGEALPSELQAAVTAKGCYSDLPRLVTKQVPRHTHPNPLPRLRDHLRKFVEVVIEGHGW